MDGSTVVWASGKQMDRIRKEIIQFFLYKSLKITVDMKIETTNILHVNLNLVTEEYKTFIKDDNQNTST